MSTQPKFPIIYLLPKDRLMGIMKNEEEFSICTEGAITSFYPLLTIIDSSMTTFRIRNAIKLHGVGMFWGYSFMYKRRIRVALKFERQTKDQSFENLKDLIINLVQSDSFESIFGIKDIQLKLRQASTFADLVNVLEVFTK